LNSQLEVKEADDELPDFGFDSAEEALCDDGAEDVDVKAGPDGVEAGGRFVSLHFPCNHFLFPAFA
jgi:hypothetical protein